MKTLKFESTSKESDNIETVDGLKEVIVDWLESLDDPFHGDGNQSIDDLEFRSRDGFLANHYNRGGVDLINITSISHLIGSGHHLGLSIEDWVSESEEANFKFVKESHPEMDTESEEFHNKVYEMGLDDYDTVAWRIRVMYEGSGVLCVYAGYDKDAPYFRWNSKSDVNFEIKFKTLSGLKRQLKALSKKIEGAQ